MLGINPHYVTDAKQIERDAPEVLEQVKQGKLSIPQAKHEVNTRKRQKVQQRGGSDSF